MEKDIDLRDLIDDLAYFQKIGDGRILILYLHLYLEHFIISIASQKGIVGDKTIHKLRTLVNQKVLPSEIIGIFSLVNGIRNKLVHTLRPNLKQMEKEILQFKAQMQGVDDELDKAVEASSPWARIQLYTIPNIFSLYQIDKETKGEPIKQDMRIETVPQGKDFAWRFVLLEKKAM